jgi:uncharacterized damage-inducible protein DinB
MSIKNALIGELKHESSLTRKMLERVPLDKKGWKPHEKSMTLGRLASHIADLTHWISDIIHIDDFDFTRDFNFSPHTAATSEELLEIFQTTLDKAITDLSNVDEKELEKNWTVRRGEQVLFTTPKKISIRNWTMNHMIHHRGQLSVYLRLLDVPVPGMYGPSADERV